MAVRSTAFHRLRDILTTAMRLGCTLRVAEETVRTEDGDVFNLRYLFSPDGVDSIPLLDLADDDLIAEREVVSWERRLGIRIPRP